MVRMRTTSLGGRGTTAAAATTAGGTERERKAIGGHNETSSRPQVASSYSLFIDTNLI